MLFFKNFKSKALEPLLSALGVQPTEERKGENESYRVYYYKIHII
jgi:hypothetical protein